MNTPLFDMTPGEAEPLNNKRPSAEDHTSTPKVENEPSPEQSTASPAPAPKFSVRKRSSKARARPRKRSESDEEPSASPSASGAEGDSVDVAALRRAQKLREKARHADVPVTSGQRAAAGGGSAAVAAAGESQSGGLRSNFAVESSGYDAQRNMEEFVEKRMAEKYGARVAKGRGAEGDRVEEESSEEEGQEGGGKRARVSVDDAEAGLYVIPDHLRVAPRQQYDPTEGLPAAGVEEVDVGAASRRKNAEETAAAVRQLQDSREGARPPRAPESGVVANVSANYSKHRRDWIVANLGPGGALREGRLDEEVRPGHGKGGRAGDCSGARGGTGGSGGAHHGSRPVGTAIATDHLVADRFRKRWRH